MPARGWQFKASVTHWRADPELRATPVSSLASAASLACPALTVSTQDQRRASILGTYTPTHHLSMGRPVYQSGRSHTVQYWLLFHIVFRQCTEHLSSFQFVNDHSDLTNQTIKNAS